MTIWQASAPTNIALIKYMGKANEQYNLPLNSSLSYTLDHLRSSVILTASTQAEDVWAMGTQFNNKEQQRFLNHLAFLKKHFDYHGNFEIASTNNFPAGCGLASSASSFAALTLCALKAFGKEEVDTQMLVALSRQGSGSSCRSFFSPWALWENETVKSITLPYAELHHRVIVVSQEKKTISSSYAHQLVKTSDLFIGRLQRVEKRLLKLLDAFENMDWPTIFLLVWQEFWDMHALFETANPSFSYFKPETIAVLNYLKEYWHKYSDGPIVTMDAGPNIHLLFRPEQTIQINEIVSVLEQRFTIL